MERLCPSCIGKKECIFRTTAESIAGEVKQCSNPVEQLKEAFIAHKRIAEERIKARERICPNLNDVDPNYHGRELL